VERRRSLLRPQGGIGAEAENVGVPEGMGIENRGGRADDRGRNGGHGVPVDEIDEGLLFGGDLLDSVPVSLAFFVRRGGGLRLHQAIDLRFPSRGRFGLPGIPLMIFRGAEPDVHLAVRVDIGVGEAEQTSLVVVGARNTLDQRRKIKGHHIHFDSDLRKILLNHGDHLFAGFIAGARDDREFDAIAQPIAKSTAVEAEACASEEPESGSGIVLRGRKRGIKPEVIGGGDGAVSGPSMAGVNDAGEVGTINGQGDGLAKFGGAEPSLLVVRGAAVGT